MVEQEDPGLAVKWWIVLIAAPAVAIGVGAWWILKPPAQPPVVSVEAPPSATAGPPESLPARIAPPTAPRQLNTDPAKDAAVAALRAENERLRRELESATAKPPVLQTPPAAAANGSVAGSVWLSKNDGSSDLQRGIHVQILSRNADATAVGQCLDSEADDWESHAQDQDKIAKDDAFSPDLAETYRVSAKEDREKETVIRQAIVKIPNGSDLLVAYKAVVASARLGIPSFQAAVKASALFDVKADVNGKYRLADVPAGRYYLHARVDTASFYAEWFVPIVVTDGAELAIDLDNENSALIKN